MRASDTLEVAASVALEWITFSADPTRYLEHEHLDPMLFFRLWPLSVWILVGHAVAQAFGPPPLPPRLDPHPDGSV